MTDTQHPLATIITRMAFSVIFLQKYQYTLESIIKCMELCINLNLGISKITFWMSLKHYALCGRRLITYNTNNKEKMSTSQDVFSLVNETRKRKKETLFWFRIFLRGFNEIATFLWALTMHIHANHDILVIILLFKRMFTDIFMIKIMKKSSALVHNDIINSVHYVIWWNSQ